MSKKAFLSLLIVISPLHFNNAYGVRTKTVALVVGAGSLATAYLGYQTIRRKLTPEPVVVLGACTVVAGLVLRRATPSVRLARAALKLQDNSGHALLNTKFSSSKDFFAAINRHYITASRPSATAFKDLVALRNTAMEARGLAVAAQENIRSYDHELQAKASQVLEQGARQAQAIDDLIVDIRSRPGFSKELTQEETIAEAKKQTSELSNISTMQTIQTVNSFRR